MRPLSIKLLESPWVLPLILLSTMVSKIPMLAGDVAPAHDGLYQFQVFHFFYSQLFATHEIPWWIPYGFLGVPSDFFYQNFITPDMAITGALGLLFNSGDPLMLFKISKVFAGLVFTTGVWRLSTAMGQTGAPRVFVTFTLGHSLYFLSQPWFNGTFLLPIPWVFAGLIQFHQTKEARHLFTAALFGVAGLFGNVPYIAPVYFYMIAASLFALFWGRAGWRWDWSKGWPGTLLVGAVFVLLAVTWCHGTLHQLDHLAPLEMGRGDGLKTSLANFLKYGGVPGIREVVGEFLFGRMVFGDAMLYVGILPVLFFAARLMQAPDQKSLVILFPALFLGSAAMGGIFSEGVYHLPGMAYFRHIGYLWIGVKVFMVVLAGEGLRHFIEVCERKPHWTFRDFSWPKPFPILFLLVITALIFLGIQNPWLGAYQSNVPVPNAHTPTLFAFRVLVALGLILLGWLAARGRPGFFLPIAVVSILSFQAFDIFLLRSQRWSHFPTFKSPEAQAWIQNMTPMGFEPVRYFDQFRPEKKRLGIIFNDELPGNKYAFQHNFFQDDQFPPYGRMDFVSSKVKDLYDLQGVGHPQAENKDYLDRPAFSLALGLNAYKLGFAANPFLSQRQDVIQIYLRDNWQKGMAFIEAPRDLFPASEHSAKPHLLSPVRFRPNELSLKVALGNAQWMIYSDAWHPDWKATVDGQVVSVYKANLAFKAVYLGPGVHHVALHFDHGSFRRVLWWVLLLGLGVGGMATVLIPVGLGFRRHPSIKVGSR